MTVEIAITLGVLGMVVLALMFLNVGPDMVLLGGLTILLVAGVLTPQEALAGFSNEGLITVAFLFVVAEGLHQTGGISFAGQRLLGQPPSLRNAQARIMVPTAVASAFLNNTPVVAMMIPVVGDWARKLRMSVSQMYLPLSYAAILGGMCTLIGTSTTLVVNGLLISQTDQRLGMFEIGWVGLPAAVAGLIYLMLLTRWLLPERRPAFTQHDDPREYTLEMLVAAGSPLIGKTIEQAGLRHLPGMYLMEIERGGHVLPAVSPDTLIEARDRLIFVGVVDSVIDLQKIPGLTPATDQVFKLDSPRSTRCLIEAVVSNSFPFLGMTIRESRFRTHYNAAVIAVARNGERLHKKIGDIQLVAGDTLLLESHPSFLELQRNSRDFFLIGRVEGSNPPRHERAWLARLLLAGMVISVAIGWLTMLKAAMLTAALMILTRCAYGSDARRSIDWPVLLVIGAGLGVGTAMQKTGAAQLIAAGMIDAAGPRPWVVLTLVYAITSIFTNLITAKAAAVLVFPIAVASANRLTQDGQAASIIPFAIAVMIAAAASFATPIGYQTNLMVYGPGGYRSSDYLRLGGLLTILVGAVTLLLIPLVWPFFP